MRARHQGGWVELTAAGTWKAHWHEYIKDATSGKELRRHRSRIIGRKSEMPKFKAKEELDKIVAGINAQGPRVDGGVTLSWFWTNRFKPMREGGWVAATRRGCETDWSKYLQPTLGEMTLDSLDLFKCQMVINKLATKGLSESVVKRVRVMLSSMLGLAVELDFLQKNPAKKLGLPVCKPTSKPTLEKQEVNLLLKNVTDQRDHLILMLGAFGSLVSSELFGLTWGSIKGDHLEIRSTAYQGKLQVGRVKRESRHRNIYLPAPLQAELEAWRKSTKYSTEDDALIFPNDRKVRGPMWPGIWLQKHIAPIAKELSITTPVTFQVLRRSFATRNQKRAKDLQAHLGHSNIQTTMNVYAQEVPDSVRDMVLSDFADVMAAQAKPVRPKGKVLAMNRMAHA